MVRGLRVVVFALVAVLLPLPALAQSEADKSQARELAHSAEQALLQKDYKTAEDLYRRADSLYHAPTLMLGLARAQAQLGKVVESWESYNRIIVEGPPPNASAWMLKAIEDAKAEIGAVGPRRARVTMTVTGPVTPRVFMDDAPVANAALGAPRYLNPGPHVVKATAEGYDPAETKFTAVSGQESKAALVMNKTGTVAIAPVPTTTTTPKPSTSTSAATAPSTPTSTERTTIPPDPMSRPGSSRKTLGFVALGVGAAGLIAGGITGVIAMGKHSDLSTACGTGTCPPDKQSDIDSYHTMGTVSTIGFIVGGVGIAAGIVLLVTAPKAEEGPKAASIRPYVGLGSIGAVGTF